MAETLTVDPTPDAELVGEEAGVSLTAEEQDSLKVGEQLIDQQENLLAGKYKDAQELEKAYINLQKKLGEDGKEETPEAEAETESEEVLQEEPEKSSEDYSEGAQLITSASDEYYSNDGKLSPETLEKFASMSSQDLVKAYMEVQSSLPENAESQAADITDATVNQIKNYAGGEQSYNTMVQWASKNPQLAEQLAGATEGPPPPPQ